MTDAAFREALEAYVDASDDLSWYDSDHCRTPLETPQARKDVALARVLALYAERQGEVYEVEDSSHAGAWMELHNIGEVVPVVNGDRVRVVRVEIGMYDPKNDPPTGGAQ